MALKNLLHKKEKTTGATINYWKDLDVREVNKELFSDWGTLLLIHNSTEFEGITNFLVQLPISNKGMMLISLTKGYDSIKSDMYKFKNKLRDINSQLALIDCVSMTVFERKSTKECYFEKPPTNLQTMTMMMNKYMRHFRPSFVILDSLSQYIDFSTGTKDKNIYEFLKYLKTITQRSGCRFVLLYDDYLNKELKYLQRGLFDKIIKYEVLKESNIPW